MSLTAKVSAYQLNRVHDLQLVRGQKLPLVADFNGAIPDGESIQSATWWTDQNQAAYMSDAVLAEGNRKTGITLTAGLGGVARLKVEVTLTGGGVLNQLFYARIKSAPFFMGEPSPGPIGPYQLTVSA